MTRPIVITTDYDAIPKRHWELPVQVVPNLAEVYRYEMCFVCAKPVRDHTWFVVNPETGYVSDCSEVAL